MRTKWKLTKGARLLEGKRLLDVCGLSVIRMNDDMVKRFKAHYGVNIYADIWVGRYGAKKYGSDFLEMSVSLAKFIQFVFYVHLPQSLLTFHQLNVKNLICMGTFRKKHRSFLFILKAESDKVYKLHKAIYGQHSSCHVFCSTSSVMLYWSLDLRGAILITRCL